VPNVWVNLTDSKTSPANDSTFDCKADFLTIITCTYEARDIYANYRRTSSNNRLRVHLLSDASVELKETVAGIDGTLDTGASGYSAGNAVRLVASAVGSEVNAYVSSVEVATGTQSGGTTTAGDDNRIFHTYVSNDIVIKTYELNVPADPPLGALGVAGYNPTVYAATAVAQGNEGTVAVAGYDPVVNKTTEVNVGSAITAYETGGWLIARGYDVNTIAITPNIGEIAVAGYNPRLDVRVGNIGEVEVSKFNSTVVAVASTTPKLYVKWKDGSGNVRQREIINRPVISSVTAAHTANILEEIVLADASGGAFSVTLPTASGKTGFIYRVKKTDASANAVTVDGNGAETIDGSATQSLSSQYEVVVVVSDGSNWWIL